MPDSFNACYEQVMTLRREDKFPEGLDQNEVINVFFPNTVADLTTDLSTVTSAFYGVMLQSCLKFISEDSIDAISKEFFYRLGKIKTNGALQQADGKIEFPRDTRGVVLVLIAAIYNASPEYQFEVPQYTSAKSVIILKGKDRYFRIASTLGINHLFEWPTLLPFFKGISDELGVNLETRANIKKLEKNGVCDIEYTITKNEQDK